MSASQTSVSEALGKREKNCFGGVLGENFFFLVETFLRLGKDTQPGDPLEIYVPSSESPLLLSASSKPLLRSLRSCCCSCPAGLPAGPGQRAVPGWGTHDISCGSAAVPAESDLSRRCTGGEGEGATGRGVRDVGRVMETSKTCSSA